MNSPKYVQIDSLENFPFKNFIVPIIVVYKNPTDFPNKYVARVWNLNHPSMYVMITDTYEELITKKPDWMVIMKDVHDEPHIIESWL